MLIRQCIFWTIDHPSGSFQDFISRRDGCLCTQSFYKCALLASYFAGRTHSSWKNRCSPFRLSSSYLAFDIRSSMNTARKTKSTPRYRYSRSGNQDMQVPTNTVRRGLTSLFSSLFLSLSFFLLSLSFSLSFFFSFSLILTYTRTHTYISSFSLSLSRSFTHTPFLFLSSSCFLSLPLRDVRASQWHDLALRWKRRIRRCHSSRHSMTIDLCVTVSPPWPPPSLSWPRIKYDLWI